MAKRVKLYIKNLSCYCCIRLLKRELVENDIRITQLKQGVLEFDTEKEDSDMEIVRKLLKDNGMQIIKTKEERIVEQIKQAVYELIFEMNNVDSIAKKSEYIVEKLGMNYRYLSRLFSKHEGITLEKYIISRKISRIKQMIIEEEYSLSEIAFLMDYASVQYLSAQFKKETGMTFLEFKSRFYGS